MVNIFSLSFTNIRIILCLKSFALQMKKTAILKLKLTCSTFGIPRVVKTDNGSPFQGHSFKDLCTELGFRHCRITP